MGKSLAAIAGELGVLRQVDSEHANFRVARHPPVEVAGVAGI
jgi:hypothetical protein